MARVDLGRGPDGKRRAKTLYGATEAEVVEKLNRANGQAVDGALIATSTPTVARLLHDWYTTHQHKWRPGTRRVYRIAIDTWLVPTLGTYRLEALQPLVVQDWLNSQTRHGAREKIVIARVVLSQACKWAMKCRLVTYNAVSLTELQAPPGAPVVPLTQDDVDRLVATLSTYRLGVVVIMALALGLRIGEVLGLRWADVDLKTGVVRVRQQLQEQDIVDDADADLPRRTRCVLVPLKTAKSRRDLTMGTIARTAMQRWRATQQADRLRVGTTWTNADGLVFTTPTGQPVRPESVRKQTFRPALAAAGLSRCRFHTLRHTFTTLLLDSGAQLVDVSQALGHKDITTTANIYKHFTKEQASTIATQMDRVLGGKV